jgi:hypothetical protein
LIHLADTRTAAPGAVAHALQPIPADDGDVVPAVDAVGTHQAARRQLPDHGAHRVAIDGVAGEDLQADGARAQRLDAEVVAEVQRPRNRRRVIGAQSMTAPQVEKSGGIARLRDMRRTPIERLEPV